MLLEAVSRVVRIVAWSDFAASGALPFKGNDRILGDRARK